MTSEPRRPLPAPDDASAPFFEGAARGVLMLMRCRACGTHRYPARDRCDACWATDTDWTEASGRGTLHSWVVFHQIYHPAFASEVPYNVATVELPEGPRITSRIVGCDPSELRAGLPLLVEFEVVDDGIALPIFRPASFTA